MTEAPDTPRRMRYPIGEYMSLNWGDDDPDEAYVRGHVTPEAFAMAIQLYGWGLDDPYRVPVPAAVDHIWGRWSCHGVDEWGDPGRILQTYPAPGRGRFPITAVPYDVAFPPTHTVRERRVSTRLLEYDAATGQWMPAPYPWQLAASKNAPAVTWVKEE